MGKDLFEIAAMLAGIAFAALLIGHPSGTATVVNAVTSGYGKLLATVELAGGYAGNSGIPDQYGGGFNGGGMIYG